MKLIRSRRVGKAAITTIGTLALLGLTAVVAAPANAVTCVGLTAYTSYYPSQSGTFQKAYNSGCVDMNAAYTYSVNDSIRGWYLSSGSWRAGTRGFVPVTTADSGWKVLVSNVRNGTTLRGEGLRYSQNVRYVV